MHAAARSISEHESNEQLASGRRGVAGINPTGTARAALLSLLLLLCARSALARPLTTIITTHPPHLRSARPATHEQHDCLQQRLPLAPCCAAAADERYPARRRRRHRVFAHPAAPKRLG